MRTVAAVADGASVNRLMQKMNATQATRGSADIFHSAEVENDIEADGSKIYLISDVSHLIKKWCNHLENSDVSGRRGPTPLRTAPCPQSTTPSAT